MSTTTTTPPPSPESLWQDALSETGDSRAQRGKPDWTDIVFFLLLAGGDLGLLFMHLGNLAAHDLAADHAAQAGFINELKLGLLGVATLIVIWRLPRFLDDVSAALAPRKEVP